MNTTQLKRNAGYTIDQTILIVAVIAILITIIIATVGWDLLQRTGGTRLAAQLRQIEDASGQFLARHGVWMHNAVTSESAANNARALVTNTVLHNDYRTAHRNLLPGYEENSNGLLHSFGNGSANDIVQIRVLNGNANKTYGGGTCGTSDVYEITMQNVPVAEVQRADEQIDGKGNANASTSGRLTWSTGTGLVNLSYCANTL